MILIAGVGMPSVRFFTTPEVLREMSDPLKEKLSLIVRETVASSFGLDVDHVEAIWVPVEYSVNMAELSVEVVYSVSSKFDPKKAVREDLAQTLADMMTSLTWLPPSVTNVASWVRPQRNAVFKIANRATVTE